MRILTVCTGNICRSPMAEAFLARELPDAVIESAGVGALVGQPADPLAVKCMNERGLDISRHVARQITPDMLRGSSMVLAAAREHQAAIERAHPWVVGRVYRLGHWLGHDIDDPYRRGEASFQIACETILAAVRTWIPRVGALSSSNIPTASATIP